MFNYQALEVAQNRLEQEKEFRKRVENENREARTAYDGLEKLIRRAVRELVPCDFKRTRYSPMYSTENILSAYLDQIEKEREEQIQDDILREKVEKIVLALRAHKWEPA